MAKRTEYQIVGRYMDGKEVTGYHLHSMETGKSGRYSRDQVAYLVGRGQVTNCEGQIYKDKVLFRGVGMNIDDLPVQQENGGLSRTDNIGKVRKGTDTASAMTQFMLVKSIISGRNTIGYVVQNAGGATKPATRQQVLEMAQAGRIGNARVQEYQGKLLLRGVNCNLNDLPTVTAEELGIAPKTETARMEQKTAQKVSEQPKEGKTTKIVSISQIAYNRYSMTLGTVEFAVYNQAMSTEMLEKELEKFMSELKLKTGHRFYNTDESYNINIMGKNCVAIFDDPVDKRLDYYIELCKENGYKLVITKNVTIYNSGGYGEATEDIKNEALSYLRKTLPSSCFEK